MVHRVADERAVVPALFLFFAVLLFSAVVRTAFRLPLKKMLCQRFIWIFNFIELYSECDGTQLLGTVGRELALVVLQTSPAKFGAQHDV